MTYIVTRNVTQQECPWLERALVKGESIFIYKGGKKPSSNRFLLCCFYLGVNAEAFEVPEDALINENWLKDRPDESADGIPILYLD